MTIYGIQLPKGITNGPAKPNVLDHPQINNSLLKISSPIDMNSWIELL